MGEFGVSRATAGRDCQILVLTSLAWALFCSGLASGSKVKAATPAALLSSSIFFWASSADTELSGFCAASMAPCCLSSAADCSVAMLGDNTATTCSSAKGIQLIHTEVTEVTEVKAGGGMV